MGRDEPGLSLTRRRAVPDYYTYERPDTPSESHMKHDKLSPFADVLVRRRLAIPISQHMLADAVGCTLAAVCNYERHCKRPTLYLASRIAKALAMPEELRAFHTLTGPGKRRQPILMRQDLRSMNPGTHGHYPRKGFKVRKASESGNYRVSHTFADLAESAATRIGYDLNDIEDDAELPPGRRRMVFETRYKDIPLVHAANIAHVLHMDAKLSDFSDADIKAIKPLDE